MLSDWKFWVLTIVAVFALVLSVSNSMVRQDNVAKQDQLLSQQNYINEAQRLANFNSQFIRALASLAAQTNDENITRLLADNGVTYTVAPPEPAEGE